MSALRWILFESPAALGALCMLTLFGLLVHWRRSLNPRPLLVGLALAVVLFVVQAVVVTDRERARLVMRPIELGLMNHDVAPLEAALAPAFAAGPRDRTAFIDYVQHQLQRLDLRTVRLRRVVIDKSTRGRFVATLFYTADIRGEDFDGTLTSLWRITFEQTDDGWKISGIEPLRIGMTPIANWRELQFR